MTASVGVGMRREQKLQQFHPHPLARQHFEPGARADAGVQAGGIRRAFAVIGVKAKEPQDAQIIFGDTLLGLADEPHLARRDIGKAADIVVNLAIGRRPTMH